jgi:hypothetical protein
MKYVIIEASEVSNVNFTEVVERDSNSLRYNADNSQTIVKFDGNTPRFLEGKTQYTHSEILAIVNTAEWNPE